MVTEATIEAVLARLESEDANASAELAALGAGQPDLLHYLTNEDTEAFREPERELLFFAALVIYRSVSQQYGEPARVTGESLSIAEDANYELLGSGKNLRDRFTPLFESSTEEELLAFAEDLTLGEEDGEADISREAREPFFITLKTVIDALT